ncbi:MAG: polysaccharide deacetylase family protein [Flavobacteriales bacterium]
MAGRIWRMPAHERSLYLTFDDGPVAETTPWVLDTLAAHGAKATFFVVGANAERHPALLRRIRDAGHAIGNHTFSHLNGWRTPLREYLADVARAQAITGTRLFRPPYGRMTWAQARALRASHSLVMWDVLSRDYDPATPPERCLGHVLRHARPGSIIVLHDSAKAEPRLRHALPRALETLGTHGYAFKPLPEAGITDAPR